MSAQPKITVHHLDNSRSSRILWMLEELNLPYSIKEYKRNEGTPGLGVDLTSLSDGLSLATLG